MNNCSPFWTQLVSYSARHADKHLWHQRLPEVFKHTMITSSRQTMRWDWGCVGETSRLCIRRAKWGVDLFGKGKIYTLEICFLNKQNDCDYIYCTVQFDPTLLAQFANASSIHPLFYSICSFLPPFLGKDGNWTDLISNKTYDTEQNTVSLTDTTFVQCPRTRGKERMQLYVQP